MSVKTVRTKGWTSKAATSMFWLAVEEQQRMRLAKTVKTEREKRHWSQRKLGEESGVAEKTISRYENARVTDPHFEELSRVAAAFGLEPEQLTGPRLSLVQAEEAEQSQLDRIEKKIDRLLEREVQRELEEGDEPEEPPESGTAEGGDG